MRVLNIPTHHVEKWWPVVGLWVQQACDRSGFRQDPIALKKSCLERENFILQVWLDEDDMPAGVMVLELPAEESVVWVSVMGGRMRLRKNLPDFLKELRVIARITRRRKIGGQGRRGWGRLLESYGFVSDGNDVFMGGA
jgi:hypothetical protein